MWNRCSVVCKYERGELTFFELPYNKLSEMDYYIVIRDYKPADDVQCSQVVWEGTMSTVNTAFIAGLMREITFQMMILLSAVMFIFFGFPFSLCLCSIPGVIMLIYFFVWCAHTLKALEIQQDTSNIPRVYMSSNYTGFWVAEAYEPCFVSKSPSDIKYTFLREHEFREKREDLSKFRKHIIGTVAVVKSTSVDGNAWLRRMAVTSKYRKKGVATALLNEAIQFCAEKGYTGVHLVTTECHDNARSLFMKKEFQLKQMYHKQLAGTLVTVLMYELHFRIKTSGISCPP